MNQFNELKKTIQGRRSVRKFTDEKIPPQLIEEWLDLALLAPNSSNLQAWEFYVIESAPQRDKMAQYCLNQSAAKTAQAMIVVVARPDQWRKGQQLNLAAIQAQKNPEPRYLDYYRKIVPMAYATDPLGLTQTIKNLAVACVGLFKVSYRGPFGFAGNRLWATKTTALAAENLMLAIHASGYDSCPMEGFDQVRVKKLLKLPRPAYVVMVLGIGRAAPDGVYGPRFRGDKNLFVKYI